ncbi:MAG: ABC transporter ATP-binding protein [Kiritimatiellia bacterium]
MNAPIIACYQLSKTFTNVAAVKNVDLEIAAGAFVALLGPSGCGKTTVLRLLAGLETPDTGIIRIGEVEIAGKGFNLPPEKRRLGMVFQEYALFPHLSVRDNIAFGIRNRPDRDARVKEVLALVDLEDVQYRGPHSLSGGQQQRVALARALAPKPAVMLLDEPFSNLDAALRQRVRREIRQILLHAGVTTLFVTHDQEEALSISDHVAVMIDGNMMQYAPPEDLYRFPANQAVAGFLGETNFIAAEANGLFATCNLGTVQLHHAMQGNVTLMIRPENIRMQPDQQGLASIKTHEYVGHSWIVTLSLDQEQTLRCRLSGALPPPPLATRVALHVQDAVMAYPVNEREP